MLLGFPYSLLKVHYHHQRRAAGVNLAPGWSAPVRTQWRSCRGDALLWRGLLPRRVQAAFTNGTQRGESAFKWLHSFARCCRVLVGGVGEDLFSAEKSREQDARTAWVLFLFVCLFIFNSPSGIHGAFITPFLNLLSRSGTVSFLMKKEDFTHGSPECRQDDQFPGTCRVVV